MHISNTMACTLPATMCGLLTYSVLNWREYRLSQWTMLIQANIPLLP